MIKKNTVLILLAMGMVSIFSCTTTQTAKMVPVPESRDLTQAFVSGEFTSKVDGMVVLLDASSSMAGHYQGYRKFDIAKAFVRHMNETMPPIKAVSGLRTFGHAPELSDERTALFYGMARYDRKEMGDGLERVNPSGGPTPMTVAINGAGTDLENIRGNKAIIIVSDGKDLTDQPIRAARGLMDKMGDSLCIYTIMIGDDEKGGILMKNIAALSSCGFMALASDIMSTDAMAEYVTDVFLSKAEKVAAVKQGEMGLGYHKPEPLMPPDLGNVHFRFDSYELTSEGKKILKDHIRILNQRPDIRLIINGHTSARGTMDYNQELSEKRAASVRDYLVQTGNIQSGRIKTIGHGETQPELYEANPAIIDSREAKANMRVVFEVVKD